VDWFATAAKGTEGTLRDELRELGFEQVRAERGGVNFTGALTEGYRACLWSRIAVRILSPTARFECPNETALYEGVRAYDFSDILSANHTLAVSAACRDSRLTHTQFIAQKTKDAIVDQLRDRFGARPDVNLKDPDVHVFVHLLRDRATLYLDYSGESLHRRGYRTESGVAPMKETLAAAVLRLSGFDGEQAVVDPMCGSGTLAIEAALWAERRAPGLARARFGFERWRNFDEREARAMRELREGARASIRAPRVLVAGSDTDTSTLEAARANAQRAGVTVEWRSQSVRDARPPVPEGVLVTNPPYGERLEASRELPRELARLIDRFYRWDSGILLKAGEPLGRTRRKPRLYTVHNGDIECALRCYARVPE